MSDSSFGRWRDMADAPKDGTRVLVEIRASEQGPAEVDLARWARTERSGEACWVSADSNPGFPVVYAEGELSAWMPLPAPLPKRLVRRQAERTDRRAEPEKDEIGGSGI